MKYSPKFFKETMPEWKRKKDPIIAQVVHRPVSFIFSSVFSEIGLTPNQVSFISLILAFATCACFFTGSKVWYLVGAILMNIWSITDSADGNMARSLGGKPYGDFIDATSSYAMVGFLFPALAFAVFNKGGTLIPAGSVSIVVIGAYTSISDTMTRLFFQKMKSDSTEIQLKMVTEKKLTVNQILETKEKSAFMKLFTRVDAELSMGGWNLLAIILCVIFDFIDLYIIFYALYYPSVFLVSTVYMIKQTGCLKK